MRKTAQQPLNAKFQEVLSRISQGNAKITDSRKAADAAETACNDIVNEYARDERAKVDAAQKAYFEKIEEKVASDPKVAELKAQIEDLRQQLNELRR